MTPKLKALIAVTALVTVGGVPYYYATRTPPEVTMAELRDAGAVEQRKARWVFCAAEHLDRRTARLLRKNGYGDFRIGSVHRICRVVWEYQNVNLGAGAEDASVVLSVSNAQGVDGGEDGGEDDVSELDTYGGGYRINCNDDVGLTELRFFPDGGFRYTQSPGVEDPFCSATNRPGRVTPPCVIPNCWTLSDGGWDDNTVTDCQGTGPFGLSDGGPRWRGCNVTPSQYSTGAQCVPVECSTVAGDPIDVLR